MRNEAREQIRTILYRNNKENATDKLFDLFKGYRPKLTLITDFTPILKAKHIQEKYHDVFTKFGKAVAQAQLDHDKEG